MVDHRITTISDLGRQIQDESKKRYKEEIQVARALAIGSPGWLPGILAWVDGSVPTFDWVSKELNDFARNEGGAGPQDAVTFINAAHTKMQSAQKELATVFSKHTNVEKWLTSWASDAGRDFNAEVVNNLERHVNNQQELLLAAIGAYQCHLDIYNRVRDAEVAVAQATLATMKAYNPKREAVFGAAKSATVVLGLVLPAADVVVATTAAKTGVAFGGAATSLAGDKLGEVTVTGNRVSSILDAMKDALSAISSQKQQATFSLANNTEKVRNQIDTDRRYYITDYPPFTEV